MSKAVWIEPFSKKLRGDVLGNLAAYRNGRPHRGQDWHPKEKSPIKAVTSGTIQKVFWTDVLGWVVIHSSYDEHFVLYAHLAAKPDFDKGDKVEAGKTVIGLVGGGKNTPSGSASTGAHLHMSVAKFGKNYKNVDVHLIAFAELVDILELFDK